MWIYDLDEQEAVSGDKYDYHLPQANTAEPCVGTDGTRIYVSGGFNTNSGGIQNKLHIYNIETDVWSTKSNMNLARAYHGCAYNYVSGYYYVFGGEYESGWIYNKTSTIEYYDTNSDTWSLYDDVTLSTPRSFPVAVSYDRYVIIAGGQDLHYWERMLLKYSIQ